MNININVDLDLLRNQIDTLYTIMESPAISNDQFITLDGVLGILEYILDSVDPP